MMPHWRTLLFVPVLVDRFIERAGTSGADAIILDLEDSVVPERKEQARAKLPSAIARLAKQPPDIIVRVNSDSAWLEADTTEAVSEAVSAIMLPKVARGSDVEKLNGSLESIERERGIAPGNTKLLPLIETVDALPHLDEVAQAPRVIGLALGSEDMAASMDAIPTADTLTLPGQMMLHAAKRARIRAYGILDSLADYADLADYEQTVLRARRLGFNGGLAIHPDQVQVMNRAYLPDADEIEVATAIVEAFKEAEASGQGAAAFRGRMIDKPVYEGARALLALSERFAATEAS